MFYSKLIIVLLCKFVPGKISAQDYYTGAVVEYEPLDSDELASPVEVMAYNIDKCNDFIEEASNVGVDIIVFPEYGVTGVKLSEEEDRERAKLFMVTGEVGRNYCEKERKNMVNQTDQEILSMVSCSAKEHSMYVVINMGEMVPCEADCQHDDMVSLYNTNFVFDRDGTLIAKYWKQNLFHEPVFEVPTEHTFTYFETDFGVTFGTFICFDALWEESFSLLQKYPNITDIVYPTAWVDELPYMLAPQEQTGWAVGMGVNFLASGYHGPGIGALGSGIYSPSGPLNYTYEEEGGSQLVIAKIPKLGRKLERQYDQNTKKTTVNKNTMRTQKHPDIETTPETKTLSMRSHPIIYEDISIYSHSVMSKGQPSDTTVCYNETFCCHASYSMTDMLPTISYHLLAYRGERGLAQDTYWMDIELCGLVLCEGDSCVIEPLEGQDQEVFQYLQLSATYSTSFVIPSILDWSGRLPDWDKIEYSTVTGKEEGVEVVLALEETALFSAAMYGMVVG
eukprot:GFUD01009470.1.p1 GENE.GFUD01009470.1~~GFUD01009470.1.p1  ORF type:complete len:507 (+),score=151.05 GFUD01009470.1:145-1665(+)